MSTTRPGSWTVRKSTPAATRREAKVYRRACHSVLRGRLAPIPGQGPVALEREARGYSRAAPSSSSPSLASARRRPSRSREPHTEGEQLQTSAIASP
jgi:hypothetical protein